MLILAHILWTSRDCCCYQTQNKVHLMHSISSHIVLQHCHFLNFYSILLNSQHRTSKTINRFYIWSHSVYTPSSLRLIFRAIFCKMGKESYKITTFFYSLLYWKWMKENDWHQNNGPPYEVNVAFNTYILKQWIVRLISPLNLFYGLCHFASTFK